MPVLSVLGLCPCPATAPLFPSLYFRCCQGSERLLRQRIPSACESGLGEHAAPRLLSHRVVCLMSARAPVVVSRFLTASGDSEP